jgi:REP element-mobilizing transposase RayT
MDEFESLSHSKWECNFIPKCRHKSLYRELRPHWGEVFRQLAQPKESRTEEGHLMANHVHMCRVSVDNIPRLWRYLVCQEALEGLSEDLKAKLRC